MEPLTFAFEPGMRPEEFDDVLLVEAFGATDLARTVLQDDVRQDLAAKTGAVPTTLRVSGASSSTSRVERLTV